MGCNPLDRPVLAKEAEVSMRSVQRIHNPGGHIFPEGNQQLSRQGNELFELGHH